MEKFKLTKELKSKWLDALKSGKYTQGTGCLHDKYENTHCCLGVLCDILPNIQINSEDDTHICDIAIDTSGKLDFNSIPDRVYGWLRSIDPTYHLITGKQDSPLINTIIETNDSDCDGKYTAVISLVEKLPTID